MLEFHRSCISHQKVNSLKKGNKSGYKTFPKQISAGKSINSNTTHYFTNGSFQLRVYNVHSLIIIIIGSEYNVTIPKYTSLNRNQLRYISWCIQIIFWLTSPYFYLPLNSTCGLLYNRILKTLN